jgi:type I restriction-modification system DNA methylase subunit
MIKVSNNTASIDFELQIRTATEYKYVVLDFIFLKYISNKFEDQYQIFEVDNDDVEYDNAYAKARCGNTVIKKIIYHRHLNYNSSRRILYGKQ